MKTTPPGLEPPGVRKKRKSRRILTWREDIFVNAYVENGGNASLAYREVAPNCTAGTARCEGSKYLARPNISDAIDLKQQAAAKRLDISRDKLLKAYAAIAFSTHDQFTKVLDDPAKRSNYSGLGEAKLALKTAKKKRSIRTDRDGSVTETLENEVGFFDRMAALNELWEKLGISSGDRKKSWADGLEELVSALRKSEEPGK